MPRPGPRRQFVGARMSEAQIAELRRIAQHKGYVMPTSGHPTISEAVREAIERYIEEES